MYVYIHIYICLYSTYIQIHTYVQTDKYSYIKHYITHRNKTRE